MSSIRNYAYGPAKHIDQRTPTKCQRPLRPVCSLLVRTSQTTFVSRSFDWYGGFDPSNQADRNHEKDGNEARCAENVRDHPAFTGGIHEDSAEGGSRDQEIPGCRCSKPLFAQMSPSREAGSQ
jgi:hypothetical protein